MTQEEQLIRRYFQTFNRHNIEGVMACFHEHPVLVGADGKRIEGRAEVRRCYEHRLPRFLTAVANCACAPATTAVQWPSRDFWGPGGATATS
jgi:ketosteroid isomerase-like protein